MATAKVKNIKKAQWQKIAKSHEVKFEESNAVRYLVEKVAEKIGVDDKIVKLDDLKQAVCDKLEELKFDLDEASYPAKSKTKTKAAPKKTSSKKTTAKKTTTKKTTAKPKDTSKSNRKTKTAKAEKVDENERREYYIAEATRVGVNFGVEQSASDILQLIQLFCEKNKCDFIPHPSDAKIFEEEAKKAKEEAETSPDEKLSKLRDECTKLGLGFGEAHTVQDLQQLINAVKGAGAMPVTPTQPVTNAPAVAPAHDGSIQKAHPSGNIPQQPPVANVQPPMLGQNNNSNAPQQTLQSDISEAEIKHLRIYRSSIMQVINSHFRAFTRGELTETLNKGNYPFTYEIVNNPKEGNKVAILLKSKGNTVRVPNDKKDSWILISG